jgi:flagellar hook-associated protein 2
VLDEVRKQTQAADSTTGQARGALAGDTSFSRLRSGIRDAATKPVTGLSDSLNQLTEIGLTVDQQGHLSDGDGKSLRAALESSPEGVDALFRGVSGRLVTLLNAYSRAGGILAQDEQSIQTQMRHLTSRISDTNKTLTARQTTLMNQMAQLSSTVDLLNTQKQWLDSLYGTTSSSSS